MRPILLCSLVWFFAFLNPALSQPEPDPGPPDTTKVIKGSVPSDPRYWQYNQWYKNNNTAVSLIVDGSDKDHLVQALEQLRDLKQRKVIINRLVVSGGLYFPLLNLSSSPDPTAVKSTNLKNVPLPVLKVYRELVGPSKVRELAKQLDLKPGQASEMSDLVDKFHITYSPAWIVRHEGQDYVIEGNFDIRKFFTASGQFISREGGNFFN